MHLNMQLQSFPQVFLRTGRDHLELTQFLSEDDNVGSNPISLTRERVA